MRVRDFVWWIISFNWLYGEGVPIQSKINRCFGVILFMLSVVVITEGVFFWHWNEYNKLRKQASIANTEKYKQNSMDYQKDRGVWISTLPDSIRGKYDYSISKVQGNDTSDSNSGR
jgi:hypothetical protein